VNRDGPGAGSGWRGTDGLKADGPGAGRLNTDWPGAASGWRGGGPNEGGPAAVWVSGGWLGAGGLGAWYLGGWYPDAGWLAAGGLGAGALGVSGRGGAGLAGGRLKIDWPGAGSGRRGAYGLNTGWVGVGALGVRPPGGGCGVVGSDSAASGQLDGERPVTRGDMAGGWPGRGSAERWPARRSKPQASQNWPDLAAVPHFGHDSLSEPDGAGGRGIPDDGVVASGQGAGAGAGVDPMIRIPHVSQKSVLADSWPAGQVAICARRPSSLLCPAGAVTSGSGPSW
jgi:hypothetical protein